MKIKDFENIFTHREGQEIHGKRYKHLIILSLMLFGTFLAIAVAMGGLQYLDYKMNDPFVKNLEISIPYEKSYNIEQYKFQLNKSDIRHQFAFDTVLAHVDYPQLVYNMNSKEFRNVKGRSLEYRDPINQKIFSKENLIIGRRFRNEKDIGFIVTHKLLEDYGYHKHALYINIGVSKEVDGYYSVPIPIVAVVKELPGLSEFAYTPYFFKAITSGIDNPFNLREQGRLIVFTPDSVELQVKAFAKQVKSFFNSHEKYAQFDPYVFTVKNSETYRQGHSINVTFDPEPTPDQLVTIYNALQKELKLKDKYHIYQYPTESRYDRDIAYDKISVALNSLNKVRAFRDYMADEFELDVEMSRVKDKENFQAMNLLTISISILLFIFSLISLVLFLYNLLKSHLEKVKMNIGTFKAFGLSNNNIKSYYKIIVYKFFFKALLISWTSVLLLSTVIVFFFLPQLSYTQMINGYVLAAIVLILSVVEIIFRQTTIRLLENTPGDLIYGRDVEKKYYAEA